MAEAWTTIPNGDVAAGAAVTTALMTALRDNPEGIAAGVSGAPRVQGKALGGVGIGSIRTVNNNWAGIASLDGHGFIYLRGAGFENGGSGVNLQARYTDDNGATWGAGQAIALPTAATSFYGSLTINLETGVFECFSEVGAINNYVSGTHTVPAGCNGFQIRQSSASGTRFLNFIALALGGLEA